MSRGYVPIGSICLSKWQNKIINLSLLTIHMINYKKYNILLFINYYIIIKQKSIKIFKDQELSLVQFQLKDSSSK